MNKPPLHIRPFAPTDQPTTKALILAGLAEHWGVLDLTLNPDLNDIASSYADGVFLTAWLGDELVATGALMPESPGVMRIVRMSVAHTHQRCGIGRALLERLHAQIRDAGCHQIVVETTSTWAGAIAFYTRYGFRPIGIWDGETHFVLDL